MTPEAERARAQAALRLLDDPLFKEAREDIYARLKGQRHSAGTTDTLLHSKLILLEQLADQFFGYFDQLAQTGKWAAEYLEQEEARKRGFADRMAQYLSFGRSGI